MTTEIREALTTVRDSVDVPPFDEPAFLRLVRAERRRRVARRAAAGVAAGAVAATVASLVVLGTGDGDRGADVADRPRPTGPPAAVPVAVDGLLALVAPDGSIAGSDVRVEEVVGPVADGVVVVGRDSRVRLVPVTESEDRVRFGRPRDLVGAPVESAHLDKDGLVLGFVDLDGTIHFREVGADTDYQSDALEPGDRVLGISTGSWLTDSSARGLVVHSRHEGSPTATAFVSTSIGTAFPAGTGELADRTVAVGTSDGVEVFEASTGGPRFGGSLGGAVSSLAPRGDVVATATGAQQADQGMSVGVWLLDAFSGDQLPMRGYDGGPVLDLAWVDDDELAVLTEGAEAELWVCSSVDRRCELRLTRPANTLLLPDR